MHSNTVEVHDHHVGLQENKDKGEPIEIPSLIVDKVVSVLSLSFTLPTAKLGAHLTLQNVKHSRQDVAVEANDLDGEPQIVSFEHLASMRHLMKLCHQGRELVLEYGEHFK